MALIKCSECGHTVSDTSDFCPNCGADIQKQVFNNLPEKDQQEYYAIIKKSIIGMCVFIPGILLFTKLGGVIAVWRAGFALEGSDIFDIVLGCIGIVLAIIGLILMWGLIRGLWYRLTSGQ